MLEHVLLVMVCSAAGVVLNAVIERYLERTMGTQPADDAQVDP